MGDAITFLQGHGTAQLIQTEEGLALLPLVEHAPTSALETPISYQKQTNPFTIEN